MSRDGTQAPPRLTRLGRIEPAIFNTAMREFPVLLEAARRHRHAGPDLETTEQVHKAIDVASSGTADGRWLVARLLTSSYLELLRRQGLRRRRDVEAYIGELARCASGTAPQVLARYEQSMSGVVYFLRAYYDRDHGRQQEMTRDRDSDLLYALTGLVASLCAGANL